MALTDSAGLLFKIRADASQATAELREVDTVLRRTDDAAGGLSSSFAGIASPAALATAGAAALGAALVVTARAAVSLVQGLYDLAKSAAEYGESIFDASEKTGLGAETLSALSAQAELSGTSFEQVTKAVTKFGVEVGQAGQGSVEAQKKMALLKVTSTDLNTALAQAFKTIAEGRTHTERSALAVAAFGERIGPNLLQLIKDTNGDLGEMTRKFKELGLTIDDEAARKADEFGDTMSLLSRQVTDLGQDIGRLLIPKITELARALSDLIKDNQDDLQNWADRTALRMQGVLGFWDDLIAKVRGYGIELDKIKGTDIGGPLALPQDKQQIIAGQLGDLLQQRGELRQPPDIVGQSSTFKFPTTADLEIAAAAKKAAEDRAKERERIAEREQQALSRNNKLRVAAERATFLEVQKEWEDAFLNRTKTEKEYVDNTISNLKGYLSNIQKLINEGFRQDIAGKTPTEIANLQLQRESAIRTAVAEANREKLDALKNIDSLQKKAADEEKKRNVEEEKAFEERIEQAKELFDAEQRLTEEVERRIEYERVNREEERKAQEERMQNAIPTPVMSDLDTGIEEGPFDAWAASWEKFFGLVTDQAPTLTSTLGDVATMFQGAFQGMANAIGNVVEQWVLYGTTGPAMMRKILAAALASIAAEAAVRAIYELGAGFAALFFNPAEATAHFTAAAIFGSIAVGAALAGRAIAGDSFKKETSKATGGASGASAGSTGSSENQGQRFSPQKDAVQNVNANEPGKTVGVPVTVTLKIADDSTWLGKMLKADVEGNGIARQQIKLVANDA